MNTTQTPSVNFDKVEIIVNTAKKCADLLKDPTQGGKKTLEAEARTQIREEAYDDLIRCIDTLTTFADLWCNFSDIIDIHNKLNTINDIAK
jgi:hypothetical protein